MALMQVDDICMGFEQTDWLLDGELHSKQMLLWLFTLNTARNLGSKE
jgi:hypothetical protein